MCELSGLVADLNTQGVQVIEAAGLNRAGLWAAEHNLLILSSDWPVEARAQACRDVSLLGVRALSA